MNRIRKLVFATTAIGVSVVAANSVSRCLSAPKEAASPPALAELPADPVLMTIVTRYVEQTRGWTKDQYTVSLRHKEGKLWHFWVYFRDARKPGMVGNDGKSFDAVLNIDTRRVEKELKFQ
jgi:hypothetical protein